MKSFNLLEYKNLLEKIKKEYLIFKNNPDDDFSYLNFKNLLNELLEYIKLPDIPSDLIYRSEKVYLSLYRIMEGTRKLKK